MSTYEFDACRESLLSSYLRTVGWVPCQASNIQQLKSKYISLRCHHEWSRMHRNLTSHHNVWHTDSRVEGHPILSTYLCAALYNFEHGNAINVRIFNACHLNNNEFEDRHSVPCLPYVSSVQRLYLWPCIILQWCIKPSICFQQYCHYAHHSEVAII